MLTGIANRSGGRDAVGGDLRRGIAELLATGPEVVLMATAPKIGLQEEALAACAAAGVSVVSTCEELSFPTVETAAAIDALDALARKHAIAVTAAGVNPGFIFDYVPAVFAGGLPRVDGVRCRRVVDMAPFDPQRLRDVGLGLALNEFADAVERGQVNGHVGYIQTGHYLAWRLGWREGVEVVQTFEPHSSGVPVTVGATTFEPGQVIHVNQAASVRVHGTERIRLELDLHLDPAAGGLPVVDEVCFTAEGLPDTRLTVSPGLPAARTGAAVAVNALAWIAAAAPGYYSLADWHPVSVWPRGEG
ncbi:hypothetical protein BVC93_16515 [Mycobacterium sp. MS1601]|nr:hypothetical protein BVC93_16515 [Mycobacterium sp. MS1601]